MEDIKTIIGKNINTQLATQGKLQKELAAYIGVKDNMISYFCAGKRAPTYMQLIRIAEYFNVCVDTLLGLKKSKSENDLIAEIKGYTNLSPKALKNIKLYNDSAGEPLNPLLERDGFWWLLVDIDDLRDSEAVLSAYLQSDSPDNIYRCYGDMRLLKYEMVERFTALIEDLYPTNQTLAEAKDYIDTHFLGRPIKMNGGLENG